jgi:nucleoid-associated protein YgaU
MEPDTSTGEVAQTASAEPAAVAVGEQEPVTRIVKPGDRLTDLVEEVYGVRDEHLVQWVQRHNPLLKNSNLIRIGDRLVFPPANHQDSGDKDDSKALPSRVP